MLFPEEIETSRMTLRKLAQADAEALFEAYKDPDHLRYMTSRPHRSMTDTRHYIEDSMQRWDAGDRKEYAISWKATNEVIGSTGAYLAQGRASLGIVLAPQWAGKRAAIEATKGMIGFLQTLRFFSGYGLSAKAPMRPPGRCCGASAFKKKASCMHGLAFHAWAQRPGIADSFTFPGTNPLPPNRTDPCAPDVDSLTAWRAQRRGGASSNRQANPASRPSAPPSAREGAAGQAPHDFPRGARARA